VARFDPIKGNYVYIEVQNVEYRVYYEENGSGIPLLCQHSAGTDGQQWRYLLNDDDITSRYRVVVPDLPYHGKSLPPESIEWWKEEYRLTKSFFVDFQVAFNHALGLKTPIFIGGCMGGCLGLYLALERPDEFRAVIGLETVLCSEGGPLDFWDHPRISNHFKAAAIWSLMAPSSPEKNRRETTWKFSQCAPSVMSGDFYYYFKDHDLTGKTHLIDTFRTPVYLLTGEYDAVVSPEDTRQLAKQIKGAKFIEMKGLGHLSLCENPEALKRYLMPILKEIAEASTGRDLKRR
jgi:pimeloyl-ACP methyl ester carboxylesterase